MELAQALLIDIPKIYTAIAELMACLTAIAVYFRFIPKKPKDIIISVITLICSYFVLNKIHWFCGENSGLLWNLGMATAMITIILILKIVIRLHISTTLYIAARVFIWAELAASLEWQLWHYYVISPGNIEGSAQYGMIAAIICYAVIFAIFYIVEKRSITPDSTRSKLRTDKRTTIGAWIIALLLFCLSNLSYFLGSSPFTGNGLPDIFYIRTLSDIIGVVLSQMFHLQKIDTQQRQEVAVMKQTLRNQYVQYCSSKDNIEAINRKYHDLKHQLRILREETDDDRRKAYIKEIESDIRKYEAENKTGNAVLDTVLTSKQNRCQNESITMTVVADGSLLSRVSVMDICTIFGNALDNAIEYEIKIAEPEKRLIHVSVSEKNDFICILIENYYMGKPITQGKLPPTTKQDTTYHGYGLKSIKYTIEQYDGFINTEVKDNWFRLQMLLPKS
ncbi:MAG: GHKL domain-containing protein [Parasporobacterium sp.]|nr:GHKL domain-containing protein [Parasporobacterium sp.]